MAGELAESRLLLLSTLPTRCGCCAGGVARVGPGRPAAPPVHAKSGIFAHSCDYSKGVAGSHQCTTIAATMPSLPST
ncbi:hypothetical protein DFJ73DRAFT_860528 [Zopfochytrium polystomum]|nr:hypothetical protein DFJ73DRAFT_860528 [Zopfochytrium polystomum]